MKKTTALYAVTAFAALSFASQAFARGGSMGGGQGHGTSGGTHQMVSTMQSGSGSAMHQRTMLANGSQQGTTGSGAQNMTRGNPANIAGHQNRQMNGTGTGRTAMQPPITTTTD